MRLTLLAPRDGIAGAVASLAIVVLAVSGGLGASTVLTLILIPTLSAILEERFPRQAQASDADLLLQGDRA